LQRFLRNGGGSESKGEDKHRRLAKRILGPALARVPTGKIKKYREKGKKERGLISGRTR